MGDIGKSESYSLFEVQKVFGMNPKIAGRLSRAGFLERCLRINPGNGLNVKSISDRSIEYHLGRMRSEDADYSREVDRVSSEPEILYGGSSSFDVSELGYDDEVLLCKKKDVAVGNIQKVISPSGYFYNELLKIGDFVRGKKPFSLKYFSKKLTDDLSVEDLAGIFLPKLGLYGDAYEERFCSGFDLSHDDAKELDERLFEISDGMNLTNAVILNVASRVSNRLWDERLGDDVSPRACSSFLDLKETVERLHGKENVVYGVDDELVARSSRLIYSRLKKNHEGNVAYYPYGVEGCMKAAEKFEFGIGKFSTHATWWIDQAMSYAKKWDLGDFRRIPGHVHEKIERFDKVRRNFIKKNGKSPGRDKWFDECVEKEDNLSEREFNFLIEYRNETSSLDTPIVHNGKELVGDFVSYDNDDVRDPEVLLENKDFRSRFGELLGTLREREEYVVRARNGLWADGTDDDMTLEEIGMKFNVTRERIRQIERMAMRSLRFKVKDDKFSDFEGMLRDF